MVAISIVAAQPANVFASTMTDAATPVTVDVTTAGTLSTLIPADQKYTITSLTVTGDLNGDDLLVLREMSGRDLKGDPTEGKLTVLDLSGANFVAGGKNYYEQNNWNKAAAVEAAVGPHCFENSILKEVKLPRSIRYIKDDAFSGSAALETIDIPQEVEEVGGYAFNGCTALKTFKFPDVKKISGSVLAYCRNLTRIDLPATVINIDFGAFNGCSALTEIHCAATTVPTLGYAAFKGIEQADITLYVPAGSVDAYKADSDWGQFSEVKEDTETGTPDTPDTPDPVRTVNVATAGSLSTLISAADKNAITTLTVTGDLNGDDILFIREMAGRDIKSQATEGKLSVLDLSGANFVAGGGNIYEQNQYNKAAAADATVPSHCFENSTLTSIKLPASVRHIKGYSFTGSAALESVEIPQEADEVGSNAFEGCSSLKTFSFPNVAQIAGSVLSGCASLTRIDIPATVKALNYGMFSGCSALTEIHCAATTVPTGYNPFAGMDRSKCTLYVPAGSVDAYKADSEWGQFSEIKEEGGTSTPDTPETGVRKFDVQTAGTLATLVGDAKNTITEMQVTGTLNGDDILCIREMAGRDKENAQTEGKLVSLDLSGASIVEGGGIYYHNNTSNINMSTANDVISEYMFDHCNLETIVFPATVKAIEGGAFGSCYNLKGTLTIPDNITRIGNYAFEACTAIEHVVLPAKLTDESWSKPALGSNVFSGCHSLKEVTIPGGFTRLRTNAFNDCIALTTVTLPASITYIDGSAFAGCTSLTDIYVKRATPPTANYGTFADAIYATCKVHVPAGAASAYQEASYWEDFANIVEDVTDGIGSVTAGTAAGATDGIYTLSGVKVNPDTMTPGIYIVRKNGISLKITVRK